MVFSENFFGSGSAPLNPIGPNGGGGDAGKYIGQSLRFRGNQRLTRSGMSRPAGDYTFSVWVKCAWTKTSDNNSIFGNNTSVTGFKIGNPNGSTGNQVSCRDGSTLRVFNPAARLRDPSAWYHFVFQTVGSNTTAFVNGVQHGGPVNTFGATGDAVLGSGNAASMDEAFHGYMADVYCIDGQILDPTVFGRYNENDVWVPTEINFAMGQSRYSDFVTTANGGGWYQDRTPERMFNPSTDPADGETFVNNAGDAIVFTPEEPIAFTTSLEVFTSSAENTCTIYLNDPSESGAGVGAGLNRWVTVATGAGQIEELRIRSGSSKANCAGIKVDGVQLLNPFLWSSGVWANPTTTFTLDTSQLNKTFLSGYPATNMFNGDPALPCIAAGASENWITWIGNLTNVTTLQVRSDSLNEIFVNGTLATITPAAGAGDVTYTITNPPSTVTDISCHAGFSGNARMYSITVNGQELVDGSNPSYGENGFHLDFSDPNDIGADRSGNGNHFTATGFNTQVPGIFSTNQWGSAPGNYETKESGNRYQPILAINAFNGDIASQSQVAPPQSWWYWVQSLTGVNTLRFNYGGGATPSEVRVNGDVAAFTVGNSGPAAGGGANNWCDVTVPADGIVNELAWTDVGGTSNTNTYCVELNGNILEDNTGTDYDLMFDSPTQNWATGNPLYPANQNTSTFADANLGMGTAGNMAYSTQAIYEPCYIEFISAYTGSIQPGNQTGDGLGFQSAASTSAGGNPAGGSGDYVIARGSGDIVRSAAIIGSVSESWSNGDVMAMTIDEDNIVWYKNNVEIGTFASPYTLSDGVQAIFLRQSPSDNPTINFGQQPFLYTPPEGYEALQTQNLPAATIRNGRDHFQALTGPGQGADGSVVPGQLGGNWSDALTISGYGDEATYPKSNAFSASGPSALFFTNAGGSWTFAPDPPIPVGSKVEIFQNNSLGTTTWNGQSIQPNQTTITFNSTGEISVANPITSTTAGTAESCFCSAIWVDDQLLVDYGILPLAQQTFPNGLWWIKDRVNTNDHQLVDSVRGGNLAFTTPAKGPESAYVAPSGNSVAWCWGTDDTGTNADAGFQILTWTGTGAARTISHDLDQSRPLDMILVKMSSADPGHTYVNNANIVFWNNGMPDNGFAYFNLANQFGTTNSFFNGNPNASLGNLTVGGDPDTNGDPVSYGAPANYVGYVWQSVPGYSAFGSVGSGQDSFVYTGFRPAFLLTKQTGATGDWLLWDTTRDINNPSITVCIPNGTQGEENGGTQQVDLLSNGIKFRGTAGSMSGNLIYCAFAENPFSSPVTAR